jgi:sugar lactone lactonase YvrE
MKLNVIFFVLIVTFFPNVAKSQGMHSYIPLPGAELYPEGIAIDSDGSLYVSSLREGRILKIDTHTKKATDFVKPGKHNLVSAVGIFSDTINNFLWVCSSDPGVSKYTGKGSVSLKKFDLNTSKFLGSFDLPKGGFCNDITKDNYGNIYVTDSFNPRILRLKHRGKRLKIWIENPAFSGEGFNLNGIDFDGGDTLYVNKYNSGKLFKINIKTKKILEVKLPRPLFAPDGLKVLNKNNLLIVEGGSTSDPSLATAGRGKITQVQLSDSIPEGKLKVIADGLDVPSAFAIDDEINMLWVVESQYDHLFKYKNNPPYSFRILGIELKNSDM